MIHFATVFLTATPGPRDNVVRLRLVEDGEPLHVRYEVSPTFTRFVLKLGSTTVDSNTVPTAFDYDPLTSVLELRLANAVGVVDFTVAMARTPTTLILYSAAWGNGVVWLHPTSTPDRLDIQVVVA